MTSLLAPERTRFSIQETLPSDAADIAALERRSFPVPWSEEAFLSEIGAPSRWSRVAWADRARLAGYVLCTHAAGEVHINKIAVAERYRRQGVATLLMDEVLSFARRIDAAELLLEVRPSNEPARAFYRGLGFEENGRRDRYYADGEDALLMRKGL